MRSTTKRLASVVALVAAICVGPAFPAHAYDTSWNRNQAAYYAWYGLNERYVYGGSTYRNNDKWDSDEGADCSGYAAKVWAVEHYTDSMTAYHPFSSWSFYNGFAYGVSADRRYPTFMSAWSYASNSGGPGDHVGMFRQNNSDGTWTTYEARGSNYGIVSVTRSVSTLISWNYHRSERKNWG